MSSVKQEVAAILMDFTEQMPEDVYMEILRQLGNIPDHKDPKTAAEIQKELDRVSKENTELDEENDLLREEVKNLRDERDELCVCMNNMAFKMERVMSCDPSFEDDNVIMFETNEQSKSFKERALNGRRLLELFNEWRNRIEDDMENDSNKDRTLVDNSNYDEMTIALSNIGTDQTTNELEPINVYYGTNNFEDIDSYACGWTRAYILNEIKTAFSGKINNYYGAIILHEDNCWTTQVENAKSFNTNPRRSQTKRDLQYMNFTNAKKDWKNILCNENNTKYIANTSMC